MEYAPTLYKALRGVFCVYKPQGQHVRAVVNAIQVKLANDLNSLKTRPVRERVVLNEENYGQTDLPVATTVPDLADHTLVLGPRYLSKDFEIDYVSRLDKDSSGVIVMSINCGHHLLRKIARARYIRTYHVKGQMGSATQDSSDQGRLVQKTMYDHVTNAKMDKVIAAIQSGHQKYMYHAAEIDPQSQEGYEIASRGLIRPTNQEAGCVVYGMKCVHFNPPNFTLEVHSINEDCQYLQNVIHNIGVELRSSAVCTQVRRIRYGNFTLGHALLHKHWTGTHIAHSIQFCRPLVEKVMEDAKTPNLERSTDEIERRSLPSGLI